MKTSIRLSHLLLALPVACILLLVPASAIAQKPAVVISQSALLGKLPSGGLIAGGAPAGTSVGVNSSGNILASTTYGGQIVQINGTTGVVTVLGSYSNPGPITVDSSDNLYIGNTYNNIVTKVPYVNGAYPAIVNQGTTTPTCTGTDTVECNLKQLTPTYINGIASMAFDPVGNFYFATTNAGSATVPNSIWECTTACLAATTSNAVNIFQETEPSGNPLLLGSLAIDKLGDVFFTDAIDANNTDYISYLKEIPALAGSTTMHAATATTLYTYTIASPSAYDDLLDGVAVDNANTVYFSTQYGGTFAMLNNGGVVDTTSLYTISPQGAKALTTNRNGKFFGINYSGTAGGDAGFTITVGSVNAGTSAVASTVTTTASTVLNTSAACTSATPPTITSSTAEFSGTVGTCASNNITGTPTYPTTISFTPTTPGTRTATLTGTSGASTGTASVTGVATGGTVSTPTFSPAGGTYSGAQSVSIADATVGSTIYYTLDTSTPTTASTVYTGPISVAASETIRALAAYTGSTNSSVASAAYVITAAVAPTPTLSPGSGSYTSAQLVTISDTLSGAAIYYTIDGTTPTASSTLYTGPISVTVTQTINAIATATGYANSAVGSATYTLNVESTWIVNQNGTVSRLNSAGTMLSTATPPATSSTLGGIAIDAAGYSWAVTNQASMLNEVSPAGALTGSFTGGGLNNPTAVSIDGLGRVWVANSNNSVSVFSNGGAALSPATGYTGGAMSGPSGIRVDQTGSIWITNSANSTVTRIFGAAAPSVNPLVIGVTSGTTGTRP